MNQHDMNPHSQIDVLTTADTGPRSTAYLVIASITLSEASLVSRRAHKTVFMQSAPPDIKLRRCSARSEINASLRTTVCLQRRKGRQRVAPLGHPNERYSVRLFCDVCVQYSHFRYIWVDSAQENSNSMRWSAIRPRARPTAACVSLVVTGKKQLRHACLPLVSRRNPTTSIRPSLLQPSIRYIMKVLVVHSVVRHSPYTQYFRP